MFFVMTGLCQGHTEETTIFGEFLASKMNLGRGGEEKGRVLDFIAQSACKDSWGRGSSSNTCTFCLIY